jgi:rhomboid protease GluP
MFGGRKKLVMCQACRGLIEASATTCPLCGRDSVPPARARLSEVAGTDHFVSRLVLTINIAIFVMMVVADIRAGGDTSQVLMRPSPGVLYDFGSRLVPLIDMGQWWRLVTPNFIHIGIIHLLFNSFALYQIGPLVEETYGSQKFIFLYLATGLVSNIGSYLFLVNGAGASGSIFGLIGLMAVYGYRQGGPFGRGLMRQMLIWAAFGLMMGFSMSNVDNVGHIGGMVAGAALGFAVRPSEPSTARGALAWNAAAVGSAALVAISFVMVAMNYGKPLSSLTGLPEERAERLFTYFNHMRDAEEGMIDSYNAMAAVVRARDGNAGLDTARNAAGRGLASLDTMPEVEAEATQFAQRLRALLTEQLKAVEQFTASKEDRRWADAAASLEKIGNSYDQFSSDYSAWLPGFVKRHGLG